MRKLKHRRLYCDINVKIEVDSLIKTPAKIILGAGAAQLMEGAVLFSRVVFFPGKTS